MVLLDDFERGSVWDFGVFYYFDSGRVWFDENGTAIVAYGTHGFSPSSSTYSSNRFGAFMMGSLQITLWIRYDVSSKAATGGKDGQRTIRGKRSVR